MKVIIILHFHVFLLIDLMLFDHDIEKVLKVQFLSFIYINKFNERNDYTL